MSDKFEDAFESSAGKGLWSLLFDLGKGIVNNLEDRKQAERAARQYFEKYNHRYGKVQVLGMPRGIPLNDIYTPVRFLDNLSINKYASPDSLEEAFREERRFQPEKRSDLNGLTVAKNEPYLTVLGGPGAGKSTFLRRIGLEAFKGEDSIFGEVYIPVFLELKNLNTEVIDLLKTIAEEFSYFGFPIDSAFVKKALNQKKLLLLFDGLDEVPKENTIKVVNAIEKLATQYYGNRFIVSCRIAAYQSNFRGFNAIEIADLEDEQIQEFIQRWFCSELDKKQKTADKCWETLQSKDNKAAKELAQSPLLLTMLCLVYGDIQGFPQQRSRLYLKALDILLEKWAAEKRIRHQAIYKGLNTELEKALLAEIAYNNFVDDRLFFSKKDLLEFIKEFLADTVDKPKYLDSDAILKAIAAQQGILVERAAGIYSFSHLTFQEYLTAQYLSQEPEALTNAIEKHLTDERWREVFILVSGINNNADQFLIQVEAATARLINTPKLQQLLSWVDRVTRGECQTVRPVGRRAVALIIVFAHIEHLDRFNYDETYFSLLKANLIPNVKLKATGYNPSRFALDLLNAIGYFDSSAFQYYNNINDLKSCLEFAKNCIEVNYQEILSGFLIPHTVLIIRSFDWLIQHDIFPELNLQSLREELYQFLNFKTKIRFLECIHFFKEFITTVNIALELDEELTHLSMIEICLMEIYLCANKLLIDSKKAAVRVKESTWKEIEEKMLRPRQIEFHKDEEYPI